MFANLDPNLPPSITDYTKYRVAFFLKLYKRLKKASRKLLLERILELLDPLDFERVSEYLLDLLATQGENIHSPFLEYPNCDCPICSYTTRYVDLGEVENILKA